MTKIELYFQLATEYKKKPIDTTRTDFIFTIQDFKVLWEIMVRFIVSLFSALNFFSVKKNYYYNLSSKLFRLQMAKIITLHNFSCDQILTISWFRRQIKPDLPSSVLMRFPLDRCLETSLSQTTACFYVNVG